MLSSSVVPGISDQIHCTLTTFPWYAIRTRSNYERTTSALLEGKGYEQYLPTYRVRRRRPDRTVECEFPLFPGYVFCRFNSKQRLPILTTPGVFSIVGLGTEAAPIPDEEIEAVRRVLESGRGAGPCPFLEEGDRIRIKEGPFEGMEGLLVKRKSEWRMVVSVTMLQRSVSVDIDAAWITRA